MPMISVIVPVYNEEERALPYLDRLLDALPDDAEILVVFDSPDDTTVPSLGKYEGVEQRIVPTLNTYGRGPANAIRFGFDAARSEVCVVTMADGSDDAEAVPALADLVRAGAVIGAGSRYMRGGRQIGGPFFKALLSRSAGLTLHWFAGVPIHDATNSFKAYSTSFVRAVGVDSQHGFEIALELVAKARRVRATMKEIPTTWRDRTEGGSNFKLAQWLPHYLRWYLFAFGRSLTVDQVRARSHV